MYLQSVFTFGLESFRTIFGSSNWESEGAVYLAQMATLRGFNFETNKRMEKLLNTKTNSVAKLFGDSVISDMAIIGRDLYVQEGPSLGVLFESNNVALLRTSMGQDRKAAAERLKETGVRLENNQDQGSRRFLLAFTRSLSSILHGGA